VGTYLRNLLLNWAVVIPLLLALVSLPWLLAAAAIAAPGAGVRDFVLVAGFVLMLISVTYLLINRPSVSNVSPVTRRWRRFQTHSAFRQFGLSSLLGAGLLLTMWWAWQVEAPGRNAVMLLLAGTLLLSWILQRSFLWWKEGRAWFHPGITTVGTEALVLLGIGALGGFLLWTAGTRLPPLLWEWPAGTMERIGWGDVYTCVAVPVFLGIFLLTATVYIGISSRWSAIAIEDRDLEYWGRAGSWLLLGSLLWILLSGLVVFSPAIFEFLSSNWAAGAAWISTGIFALLAGGSGKTPAAKSGEAAAPLTRLLNGGVKLAAPLAIALILILLAFMADRLIREAPKWEGLVNVLQRVEGYMQLRPLVISDAPKGSENSVLMVLAVMGALAVFGSGAAALINMNRFSLHGVYRNRLIRAFLGASRLRRHPHWFTGFDEDDNLAISHLKPGFLQPEHLLDPVKLVSELKQPGVRTRVLSRHLLEVFKDRSPTLVKMIREHRDFEWPSRELSHELVQELNTVLAGPSLLEQSLDLEECDLGPGEQPLKQPTYIFRRAVRRLSIFRFLSRPAGPRLEAEVPVVDEETCPSEIRELSARHTDTVLVNRYILAWQYEGLIAPPADQEHRPLHVVNAALNLTGGDNLAWQERKADSFTISAFHCGNRRLGYRRSEDYGHGPNHGIALGTAVTISGAAASPNMGYHSSPAVTFLLALFNVRLGCWLGNPGIHGKDTFHLWAPRMSLLPFLHEALGHTRDHNPYVYLSDGGHFENLGLYEMVLRRCRFIILSDAGADPKCQLGDLANAIRKIRVDLGVPIEFDNFDIKKRDVLPPGKYCAIGRIQYSCVDEGAPDGLLLYIKPSLCGKEPRDIFNYQEGSQFFPHEPTSDQFFSESQFESYRTLGVHIVQKIARHWPKPETLCMREKTPLEQFIAAAHAYMGEKPSCPCEESLGGNGGAQTPEQRRNARISVHCPFEEL
jgi:hypothetical protein